MKGWGTVIHRRLSVSVCREGWYYFILLAFILAGAMIRDINLLFILAGMMFGPLVLSWLLVRVMARSVQFQRQQPEAVSVDDLLIVELVARNTFRWFSAWGITAQDQVGREAIGEPAARDPARIRVFFPHIPAGGEASVSYRLRLRRRGRYLVGPLRLTTRVPLGLLQATATCDAVEHLLVCPRLGYLLPAWKQKFQPRHEGGPTPQRRQGQLEGDYYGLRDWRSGDSRRWIHWRTSARRNKLSVKQFEQHRNQDLAIFLDLWQPPSAARHAAEQIEAAVSFVATLVAEQCKRGNSQLRIACTGERPVVAAGMASPIFLQDVMETLATVEPGRQDHLPRLLADSLPELTSTTRIVTVGLSATDLSDTERFAAAWHHARGRRRLANAVDVPVDSPAFHQWFGQDPQPWRRPPAAPTQRAGDRIGQEASA